MFRSLAIAGFLAASGAAAAQVPGVPGLSGFSLRAGAFFPGGGPWSAFGLDYKIMSLDVPSTPLGAHLFLSADYMSRGGSRNIALMANVGASLSGLRGSFGLGAGFNRRAGGTESTDLMMQLGLAYDISAVAMPIFIEGKYWRSDDADFSGFAVYVGVRF